MKCSFASAKGFLHHSTVTAGSLVWERACCLECCSGRIDDPAPQIAGHFNERTMKAKSV